MHVLEEFNSEQVSAEESLSRNGENAIVEQWGPSPVDCITGAWKFDFPARHFNRTQSMPGHLLHFILEGSYDLEISGRRYHVTEGDLISYYGKEKVIYRGNESAVSFYSVSFQARKLLPLPADRRVLKAPQRLFKCFEEIYVRSNKGGEEEGWVAHAALLKILYWLFPQRPDHRLKSSGPWLDIEAQIREEKMYHLSLQELLQRCQISRATLVRACRAAVGTSPVRRLRELRMEEARSLLLHSGLNISDISRHLGYDRQHDFSRDFKKMTGISPRDFRKNAGF